MDYVVKLTHHGGQYRVTLPRELVKAAGWENAEVLRLVLLAPETIAIEEYHGKSKEKRSVQKDKA